MPSAPPNSGTCERPMAAMTSGWGFGKTYWAMRQPLATTAPAVTALSTASTGPQMTTMYLPEQMLRESTIPTFAALSMASATANPAATLVSSMMPMDLSFMIVFPK